MKPIRKVTVAPTLMSLFSIVALAAEPQTTLVELSMIRLKRPQGEVLSLVRVVTPNKMILQRVVSEQPMQLFTLHLPDSCQQQLYLHSVTKPGTVTTLQIIKK